MRGIQLDAMRGIQCYVKTQDSYACLTQAGPTLSAESPGWHTSGTKTNTHILEIILLCINITRSIQDQLKCYYKMIIYTKQYGIQYT